MPDLALQKAVDIVSTSEATQNQMKQVEAVHVVKGARQKDAKRHEKPD